jgi:hypothetical protein
MLNELLFAVMIVLVAAAAIGTVMLVARFD